MRKLCMNQERRNGEVMNRNLFKYFVIEGCNYFDFVMRFKSSFFISNVQLKAVFEAYRQFSKHDIEADIKSETSGALRKGLLTIGKREIQYRFNTIYFFSSCDA